MTTSQGRRRRSAAVAFLLLAAAVSVKAATTASPGGQCGPSVNAVCPSGQCCSQYGWCGVTTAHCGSGCQSSWGTCSGGSSGGGTTSGTTTAPSGGQCGASVNAKCPSGECCSQYGWCGTTSAHCGSGCQSSWGTCSGSTGGGGGSTGGGSGTTLYSNSGRATYYYDVRGNTCPANNLYAGWSNSMNTGYPACSPAYPGQSLNAVNSNNIVAIDAGVLANNKGGLCGKRVKIQRYGQEISAPDGGYFFVWDGCAACQSAGGGIIDLSLTGWKNTGVDCAQGVADGITYQVLDQVVKTYVP